MASDWNDVYNTELSPLHYEMVRFAEVVVPTQEETIYFQELVSIVDEQVVDLIGRRARVEPFGSFAMGLSAHFSDLDLVVLNILRVHSNGMNVEQKARAIKILYKLANNLAKSKTLPIRNMRVSKSLMITDRFYSIDDCTNQSPGLEDWNTRWSSN